MLNKVSVAVVAVAVAVGGVLWHRQETVEAAPALAATGAPAAPSVTVVEAQARAVARTAEFTGLLEAVQSVQLRPRVGGYVQSVDLPEGSTVRKGQPLFRIDPRPFEATLQQARARLRQSEEKLALADLDLGRTKDLVGKGVASKERFDTAVATRRELQAQVEEARGAVEAARLDLEYTRIAAPIDGRVGRALVTEGNLVTAIGEPTLLAAIVSVDPIHVYFDIDEATYLKLVAEHGLPGSQGNAPGLPVFVGLPAEKGHPREARLDFLDNRADPATGTVRARAVLANPDHLLAPGLFVRVKLVTSPARETVLIPDEAVGTQQGHRFVRVVGKGNVVEYRPIELGPVADGLRTVTTGLAPGETIILKGMARPGMTVSAQKEPTTPAATNSTASAPPANGRQDLANVPDKESTP